MYRLIFCILLSSFLCSTYSQEDKRLDLEKRKYNNLQEIEFTSKLIQQTETDKVNEIKRIAIIEKRIEIRENIINDLQKEISIIENIISENEEVIRMMEADLNKIKEEYEKVILYYYYNRNAYNRLMFILSSKNFNQAYKRIKYLQQYTQFRKKQTELIIAVQSVINSKIVDLIKDKDRKSALIVEKSEEGQQLSKEKLRKNNLVQQLKKKESELKVELAEKRRISKELDEAIRKLIAEEAAKARKSNIYKLTPEEQIVSDKFESNKGRIPWPTERGVITSKFGEHAHPVLKGIKFKNDGIDITTLPGSEVRAVFDGEVKKVIAILGANNTVLIRHGNFLTVYQNLVNVKVKTGDKVNVKDIIGYAYSGDDEDNSTVHFEIWNELKTLNPEDWIVKF
ncbi:MAG: murein hydrolase activator EnvC family protein [Bacteroidota bacterium]